MGAELLRRACDTNQGAIASSRQWKFAFLFHRPSDTGSAKVVIGRGSGPIPEELLTTKVCHSGEWSHSAESFSLSP